jgi:hypothetical protein
MDLRCGYCMESRSCVPASADGSEADLTHVEGLPGAPVMCKTFTFKRCPDTSLIYKEFSLGRGCGPGSRLKGTVWCPQRPVDLKGMEAEARNASGRVARFSERSTDQFGEQRLMFANHMLHTQPNVLPAKGDAPAAMHSASDFDNNNHLVYPKSVMGKGGIPTV